jgi:hypothetical protein
MKKFLGVAVAALAFASANSASAQTFVSTAGTYTFSGSAVKVQKGNGPVLTCTMAIDITNAGGVLSADNPVLTGNFGFCDTVILQDNPWPVSVTGGGGTGSTATVGDATDEVYANTTITPGNCKGTIPATVDLTGATEDLVIDFGFPTSPIASTMPQVTANGPCKIDGTISW